MDRYVTGSVIRRLRENSGMTQAELAAKLYVSGKAVSKWETGKGLPDITLLEPLARALGVSVLELLAGDQVKNTNKSANMARSTFFVCPVCGNVILSAGEAVVSCCGITLPPLEPEEAQGEHEIRVEVVEGEYFVTLDHPMSKSHSVSFLAAVSDQGVQLLKLYPEGGAQGRFPMHRVTTLCAYCNRHGLFQLRLRGGRRKL